MRPIAILLAGLLAQTAAPPTSLSVRILDEQKARVTISGTGSDMPAGPFQGSVSVNGSDAKLPVTGTVTRSGAGWSLPIDVRFASVPADWAERIRPDTFACKLEGRVGETAKQWTESGNWKQVEVDAGKETQEKFLSLRDVRLTEMTLTSSEGVAELAIVNPFAFPLRIAETEYTLSAEGQEVGGGGTKGLILHPTSRNVVSLPVEIDHGALLSAAGKSLLSGGDVRVELNGKLVVRMKGGDIPVPLHLTGHLTDAS
jgi:LEA14-like dessication related protein